MAQRKSAGESATYTMSNEFSADSAVKIIYGTEYDIFSKFDDAPGQINIFETSEELFDWTGGLAKSCQGIVVDVGNLGIDTIVLVVAALPCTVVRAQNGRFHGSKKDVVTQVIAAVVDDRTITGRRLGKIGKHYDELRKHDSEFVSIISEHIDLSSWLSSGEEVRKTFMGEVMGDAAKYIEENQGKTTLAEGIEKGLDIAGFKYVEYGDGRPSVFESTIDPMVQMGGGFSDWIDSIGTVAGMDIDEQIVVFQEGGYEYRVELWKGSYGLGGTTGAEIGLYRRTKKEADKNKYKPNEKNYDILYRVVPESRYCKMSYTLYDKEKDQEVFSRNTTSDSQEGDKGWWPLTMRAGYVSDKEDLVMKDVTIEFWNKDAAKKFVKEFQINNHVEIERKGNVVKYSWGEEMED